MRTHTLALPLALALHFAACTKPDGATTSVVDAAALAAPKTTYTCKLQVSKKAPGPEYSGTATGDDEAKTLAAAWADVCGKLPEADRPACKDDVRFRWTESGGSIVAKGKTSYTKTITLVPVVLGYDGKGTSAASEDEACKLATAEACKAAGAAAADCTAGGEYEAKNIMKTSETSRL
jgi:hypothetical protein